MSADKRRRPAPHTLIVRQADQPIDVDAWARQYLETICRDQAIEPPVAERPRPPLSEAS